MTFIELILFLTQRGEKILSDKEGEIISSLHRYYRNKNLEWVRDNEPGTPVIKYNRGGAYYVWHKQTEENSVSHVKD